MTITNIASSIDEFNVEISTMCSFKFDYTNPSPS